MTAKIEYRDHATAQAATRGGTRMPPWVFLLGAVIVVIAAIVWLSPILQAYLDGTQIPRKVRNNSDRAGVFVVHVLTGTIALLLGALQIYSPLRDARPGVHRQLGRLYVAFVFVAAGTSLALDPRLYTFGTGYLRQIAGVLWPVFTILGVVAIHNHDVKGHRQWMLRSYAFAYMGLTFLFLSWIGKTAGLPLEYRYPLVIWLSFLVNMLAAECVIRSGGPIGKRRDNSTSSPARNPMMPSGRRYIFARQPSIR